MPPIGKKLVTPERPRPVGTTPPAVDPRLIAATEKATFLALQAIAPAYRESRGLFGRGQEPAQHPKDKKDRPTYRHSDQPHHHTTTAWTERYFADASASLVIQEYELAGMDKNGQKATRSLGEPIVKVATNEEGGVDFPGESAYLFTPNQRLQALNDTLDTLRLINEGIVEKCLDKAGVPKPIPAP